MASTLQRIFLLLGTLLLGVFLSCTSKEISTDKPAKEEVIRGPTAPVEETWQTRWESLKAQARKEGKIVIGGDLDASARQTLGKIMKEQFGIEAEFATPGGSRLAAKVTAERRSGLYLEDVLLIGSITATNVLKPAGFLEPLGEVVFLPEVLDPKAWFTGEVLWVDKERSMVIFIAAPARPIIINTDLVKREEIKSYRDLLDPRWKGRILMSSPADGTGAEFFHTMKESILGLDYLRELIKQEPMIIRELRLFAEWIARGKYPLGIAGDASINVQFMAAGAPIDRLVPVEGAWVSASYGNVVMLKNAPHPNAAKLFVNWVLTREGGTFLAEAMDRQSARVDVPTHFLPPAEVREPGVKYRIHVTEEDTIKKGENRKLAEEMFGHLMPK